MNKNRLYLDIETRSNVNIKETSTYNYATDESTETIVVCYAFEGQKGVKAYVPRTDKLPDDLEKFKGTIIAHNFWFEYYNMLRMCKAGEMPKHFTNIKAYECTMARAYAAGLPGSLNDLSVTLKLKNKKFTSLGDSLINKYSHKYKKNHRDIFAPENKEDFRAMIAYCAEDVMATQELSQIIPPLGEFEQSVFEFDKVKNSRGLYVDQKTVKQLIAIYNEAIEKIESTAEKKYERNERGTLRVTSNSECKALLKNMGVNVDNVQKGTLNEVYDNTNSKNVKELIDVRRALTVTNAKKIFAFEKFVSDDGTVKNATQYYYAITGRDAGRGIQPQNFYGQKLDQSFNQQFKAAKEAVKKEPLKVPSLINKLTRGCLIAPEGEKFFIADYSTIEPRVLFYVAQARNGLEAFKRSVDIYKFFAAYRFKKKISQVTKDERSWGKVAILSFGYWQSADSAADEYNIPFEVAEELQNQYFELFPEVRALGRQLYRDATNAVRAGDDSIIERHGYSMKATPTRLVLQLLSGRELFLFRPHFKDRKLFFYPRKGVASLWPGRLIDYVVQGTARDIMKVGSMRAEKTGFKVGLEVHDEIVSTDVDRGAVQNKKRLKQYIDILEKPPSWFPDMIKAGGEISRRYKKI